MREESTWRSTDSGRFMCSEREIRAAIHNAVDALVEADLVVWGYRRAPTEAEERRSG